MHVSECICVHHVGVNVCGCEHVCVTHVRVYVFVHHVGVYVNV